MDLREYQSKSIRTNKWRGVNIHLVEEAKANNTFIPVDKCWEVAVSADTEHMLIGMFSELIELEEAIRKEDQVNIEEEVGDVMWYTANEASMNRIPIVLQTDIGNYQFLHLVRAISDYTGIVKRINIYGKPGLEAERAEKLQRIVTVCFNFSAYQGFGSKINLLKAFDMNIAKLIGTAEKPGRYAHFYSDEQANNRDLEKERNILEEGSRGSIS